MPAPPCLSEVSPTDVVFETVLVFVRLTMALSRTFREDRLALPALSTYASLLQAIDGVMSLALCPQVVSTSTEKKK